MSLHGEGMDLFDYIELNRDITQDQVRAIFRQVTEAVQHLHHNKIVHRDIKDENVIIDCNDQVQLIDFGSAAYVKSDRMFETFSGTLDYAAPEILSGSRYHGPPQDIWSLGILLYTLVFKENPFYNIEQAMSREPPKLLQVTNGWQGAADLMQLMLSRNIDDRPTIDQVLAHPWLLQV
jgi:serine/threonine protein kinase